MQYINLGRLQEGLSLDAKLNNCGYYKDVDKPLHTRRTDKLREDYHIILVRHGEFQVWMNGAFQTATDGDLVYIQPHTPQDYIYKPGEDTAYYWLHFEGVKVDEMMALMNLSTGIYHPGNFQEFISILDKIITCPSYSKPAYYFTVNGLLQQFISTLYRTMTAAYGNSGTQGKVMTVISSIQAHPEATLAVADYAAQCGISEFHFTRLFRAHTGTTPLQFRNRALMEKAGQLLLDTDMNVGEIAQTVQIEDALYFSRLFKKHFGLSPSAYRKSNR